MRKTLGLGFGAALLAVAIVTVAIGANPRYIQELRIGGGYSEAVDGGVDMEADGDIFTDGDLTVDGAITGGSLTVSGIASDTDVTIDLDDDNDGSNSLIVRDGADATVALISEAGAMTLNGADGIDMNPGSDIDADVITVSVNGSPTVSWDESQDGFDVHGYLEPGGLVVTGSDIVGGFACISLAPGDDQIARGFQYLVSDDVLACGSGTTYTNFPTNIDAGEILLAVHTNIDTAVVGNDDGDNALNGIGIGNASDPDAYDEITSLAQNQKSRTLLPWSVLGGSVTVRITGTDGAGNAVTETFASGAVRVRYYTTKIGWLPDAP